MTSLGKLEEIGFKGDRKYLTGADVFNSLIRLTGAQGPASLQFHKLLANEVEAFEVGPDDNLRGLPVSFVYHKNGKRWRVGLRELPASPAKRTPYDEDLVALHSEIEGATIRSIHPTPYTFIERAVALNKRLVNQCLNHEVKWIFGRLDLTIVPPFEVGAIEINLVQSTGTRLTKSSIVVEDRAVGSIYFSGLSS